MSAVTSHAQFFIPAAGNIATTAGDGISGYTGDGGFATHAELSSPWGLAEDSSGNLYISDTGVVRKLTTSTGLISTVAGIGSAGYSGDGGSATSAKIECDGIAVDSAGNLYIADVSNLRVRKVTASTGIITTIAGTGSPGNSGDGGAATSATMTAPISVAVDSAGNVYIDDIANNVIRKVTVATGIITRVAGNGTHGFTGDGGAATSAELGSPIWVSVDRAGNILIADQGNDRVRKVNGATGIITTVAGNGTHGFTGDGGAATSAELGSAMSVASDNSGNLYISDEGNNRIREVNACSGIITTIAGNGTAGYTGDGSAATSAELNGPIGVVLDNSGNLYIADSYNNVVRIVGARAVSATPAILAGNGTRGFLGDGGAATSAELNSPYGVAQDFTCDLYVSDQSNFRVRKVAGLSGTITTVVGNGTQGYSGDGGAATSAELNFASGVALDSAGNLYIADTHNQRVRKVAAATGIITTVAGNGTQGFTGDGSAATSAELYYPIDVAVDSAGNLYIADSGNNRIREVAAGTGVISTLAGNGSPTFSGDNGAATLASLYDPLGVAVDSAGNIYITDQGNERIRKVTKSTGIITSIAGNGTSGFSGDGGLAVSAELSNPTGLVVSGGGNIYFSDSDNGRIRAITPANGKISTVLSGLTDPVGVTLNQGGLLLFADSGTSVVKSTGCGGGTGPCQ